MCPNAKKSKPVDYDMQAAIKNIEVFSLPLHQAKWGDIPEVALQVKCISSLIKNLQLRKEDPLHPN